MGHLGKPLPASGKTKELPSLTIGIVMGPMLKAELQVRLRHNALPHTDVGVTSRSEAMGPGLLT